MIRRPGSIVALLTALNFLNYIDRLILGAVLPSVKAELGLSNFQSGLLATIFLLGYFVTAPIFGALAERYPRRHLIAFGILMWSVATIATGLVHSLTGMFIARALVGVGEASFVTLAPTIINDVVAPAKKGRALAIFFLAVPLGGALGFVVGGFIGKNYGWREAFFVAGGPGVMLALTCLLIAEPAQKLATAKVKLIDTARALMRIPMFRIAVIGYCAHTAAVGAFSFWAPTYLYEQFGLDLEKANFRFGIIIVVGGAIGTIVGGWWADRSQRRYEQVTNDTPHDAAHNLNGMGALLKICALGVGVGGVAAFGAFASPDANLFFGLVLVSLIGVFLLMLFINSVMLRSVPAAQRVPAMALCIFMIHAFGDLWSQPALGKIADVLPIRLAMMLLPVVLCVAAVLWWPRKSALRQSLPQTPLRG